MDAIVRVFPPDGVIVMPVPAAIVSAPVRVLRLDTPPDPPPPLGGHSNEAIRPPNSSL